LELDPEFLAAFDQLGVAEKKERPRSKTPRPQTPHSFLFRPIPQRAGLRQRPQLRKDIDLSGAAALVQALPHRESKSVSSVGTSTQTSAPISLRKRRLSEAEQKEKASAVKKVQFSLYLGIRFVDKWIDPKTFIHKENKAALQMRDRRMLSEEQENRKPSAQKGRGIRSHKKRRRQNISNLF